MCIHKNRRWGSILVVALLALGAFSGLTYGQTIDPTQTDPSEIAPPPEPIGGGSQTASEEVSPGIQKEVAEAVDEAGYSDEDSEAVQKKVEDLVAAGVPQGIVLTVIKKSLADDLDANELLGVLNALQSEVEDGMPPGKAMQKVLGNSDTENQEGEADSEDENGNSPDEKGPPETPPGQEDKDNGNGNEKDKGNGDKDKGPPDNAGPPDDKGPPDDAGPPDDDE